MWEKQNKQGSPRNEAELAGVKGLTANEAAQLLEDAQYLTRLRQAVSNDKGAADRAKAENDTIRKTYEDTGPGK